MYYLYSIFFFFNDTATTEIYTLSLHDALPISRRPSAGGRCTRAAARAASDRATSGRSARSEEHTSELQSPCNLVCRLLLEKKKKPDCMKVISGTCIMTSVFTVLPMQMSSTLLL